MHIFFINTKALVRSLKCRGKRKVYLIKYIANKLTSSNPDQKQNQKAHTGTEMWKQTRTRKSEIIYVIYSNLKKTKSSIIIFKLEYCAIY